MTDEDKERDGTIEQRIIEFIQSELVSLGETVHPNDELLTGGVLDSIGALRLAAFVEEDFKFKMNPADFLVENFGTVADIAEYVRRSTER